MSLTLHPRSALVDVEASSCAWPWPPALGLRHAPGWIDIQPDEDGREQDAREEVGWLAVVARGHTTPRLRACEATLDAVAQAVPGFVKGARLLATARRDDRLGPPGLDRFDQGAAVVALVSQPGIGDRLARLGITAVGNMADEFRRQIEASLTKCADVVRMSGIRID
jgi:hypothetical protein